MGEYKVVFSRQADRDLEQIVRYVARHNSDAAMRLGMRLLDRALSLGELGGALIGSALTKRPEIRRLVEGKYLIYYRVFNEKGKVRILRLWHAARDPGSLRLDA